MVTKEYSRKVSGEKLEEMKELSRLTIKQMEKYNDFSDELFKKQFSGIVGIANFKEWKENEKGIRMLNYSLGDLSENEVGNKKDLKYATKKEKEINKDSKLNKEINDPKEEVKRKAKIAYRNRMFER